jgi:AsmA protein
MKRPLKLVAIVVGSLLLLLIVAFVVLTLLFDPNQYKDTIIEAVKAQTGRDIKIEKRIGWSIFPRIAVEAGGLELSNAPGFGKEPFVQIDAAGVALQLWPLLSGKVAVDTFYLHGLRLNLAKDAKGRNNWADMAGASKPAPGPAPKAGKQALPITGVSLGRIEVRSANIVWRDAAAGSTLQVRNAELTTGRFAPNEPFDLKAALELVRDRAAPIKTGIASRVTLAEDALTLDKLDLRVDEHRLSGRIDVSHFAQPSLRFELASDKLDLDKLMATTSGPAPASGSAAPAGGQQPVEIPIATLRSLDVQGRLRIASLKAMNLNASEVQLPIIAKSGLITLGPSSAKLYGGTYQGTTSLDARGKVLALNINEAVSAVNLAPLLKDMYGINAFHGRATANARLTGRGNDATAIRSTLTGDALFTVQDGTIKGVDLKKMADAAENAIKALRGKGSGDLGALIPAPGDETRFTRLGGTVQVTNGIARNNDLALESPSLVRVQGKGSADLVRETLDYRVTVGTVPILIKGPFTKLTYTPDVEAMATRAVERQIEKKLKERFKLP